MHVTQLVLIMKMKKTCRAWICPCLNSMLIAFSKQNKKTTTTTNKQTDKQTNKQTKQTKKKKKKERQKKKSH